MKPKRYILNYDWLDYKKGYVFETNVDGSVGYMHSNGYSTHFSVDDITLLILSNALTPLEEEKALECYMCIKDPKGGETYGLCSSCLGNNYLVKALELPELLGGRVCSDGANSYVTTPFLEEVVNKTNEIIRYLKHKNL